MSVALGMMEGREGRGGQIAGVGTRRALCEGVSFGGTHSILGGDELTAAGGKEAEWGGGLGSPSLSL